jgi:RNA polymerase sigma-70 factor (ECF subfamily)
VFEELPFRDIAEIAECSEDSAKANFHHALKRLRTLMVAPDAAPVPPVEETP